jgi:hypothetical protein
MEASPVRIVQYFDGSKQNLIPLFQRPYSWDKRDWQTLWDDLIAQYSDEDISKHFMGAIVTVPVSSVPVGVTKHLVIDGQQRLTTLAILLCAIRDQAAANADHATAGIIGDLLINRHYQEPDDLKLVPTQSDRDAFRALVEGTPDSTHSDSAVHSAHAFFLEKLAVPDADDEPIRPSEVLQTIQQALQVVMINLGESDDPYLIFESLNHKGKPLSQADLVRNYVLMRFQHSTVAGGEQERVYHSLWRPLESMLSSSMTEFLRHYSMRFGRNVKKDNIYIAAKSEFDSIKTADEVRHRLVSMKLTANAYADFIEPERVQETAVAERLKNMRELDSTVFYPLLLRLFDARRDNLSTERELLRCLDTLESYYVRRLVCEVPTNALNKITLELCNHLPSDGHHAYLVERLALGSGGRRWPTDEEFREALIERKLYPRRRIARFILVALEKAHEHKEPVDTTAATIEHIMPQTPSQAWIDSLGTEWELIHDKWLDVLGNLTLTGYNAELGNASFSAKRDRLKTTHFELNRTVLNVSEWGPTEIAARGAALGLLAVRRWSRP